MILKVQTLYQVFIRQALFFVISKEIPVDIQSVTTISDSGTVTMSKLGHYTVRNTNDVIIVDDIITKGDVK